jgi:hypothetical protein
LEGEGPEKTDDPAYAQIKLHHLVGSEDQRYLLCAKYGGSCKNAMPDRYIKSKGIIAVR